jgi:hypothetical protein
VFDAEVRRFWVAEEYGESNKSERFWILPLILVKILLCVLIFKTIQFVTFIKLWLQCLTFKLLKIFLLVLTSRNCYSVTSLYDKAFYGIIYVNVCVRHMLSDLSVNRPCALKFFWLQIWSWLEEDWSICWVKDCHTGMLNNLIYLL